MPTSLQQTDLSLLKGNFFHHLHCKGFAPTSGHDDNEVDHFYKEIIDQTPKKDILVVQEDWNAQVGPDAQADLEMFVDLISMPKQRREVPDF